MHRLAVISDTHIRDGKPALPQLCVELLRSANTIVHAGDLLAPDALAMLRALGPPVVAVRGNADLPSLSEFLPETAELDLDDVRISVVHDAGPARGRLERMRRRFPASDAVVFGHSHIPLHETAADGFQLFNPGSATRRRRQPSHTMGLAIVDGSTISIEVVVLD